MSHALFLSHDSRDAVRAHLLAQAITRLTLQQITVWHSSDPSPTGGLRPGNVWLDEIRARLTASKAVVVLLTPTSLSRPWILFESGFGAGQPSCDVIPVCVGISVADVPFPLSMYQTFQLSDYESLKRFLEKLLAKYGIPFDEQMCRPILKEVVKQLSQALEESAAPVSSRERTLSEAVSDLKEHIDNRLLALLPGTASEENGTGPTKARRYDVAIDLNLRTGEAATQFVEIDEETSVQDVLNHIYFMLQGEVEPRTYLEQWVLRDMASDEHLVVREVQSRIPAKTIFTTGSRWAVVRLPRPYTATDQLSQYPSTTE